MSRRWSDDPALLLGVAAATSVGGLLAVGLLELLDSFDRWTNVVLFAAAVVVVSVVAVALLAPDAPDAPTASAPPPHSWGSPERPAAPRPEEPRRPQAHAPADAPSSPTPPGSVALRVPGSSWWEATAGSNGTGALAANGSSDATVDLSTDAGPTRVVQCPRCGGFRTDVRQQEPGFAFTCRSCGHPWQWSPGAAWPASVVRPRRTDGRIDSGRSAVGPA